MTVRRAFGPTEGSVGAARQFVVGVIVDAPPEVQDSVSLMVSELSTNALVHGDSGFDIRVDRTDHAVVISVSDRSGGTPALQSPASSEPHGRGLRIVDALSDEWGIAYTPHDGKTVWFRMSMSCSGGVGSSDAAAEGTATNPEAWERPLPVRRATPWATPKGTETSKPIARRRRAGPKARVRAETAARIRRRRSTR